MPRKKQRRSYGIGRKFRRGRLWWVAVYDGAGEEIRRPTHSTEESEADALLGRLLRERSRGELVAYQLAGGFYNRRCSGRLPQAEGDAGAGNIGNVPVGSGDTTEAVLWAVGAGEIDD